MDSFGLSPAVLREGLILYIVLVASLSIHEWAHAFAADKLGDDTPRLQGRVTLNPIVHMDLLGTVIFPLVCIFILGGSFFFGWGKPVMVNHANFTHKKRDDILTTLAGPFSNLVLALLAAIAGGLVYKSDPNTAELFMLIISLNVALAVFNMIPLPPLDGSRVMRHVVGMSEETFINLSRWSFLILMIGINLPPVRAALGFVMQVCSIPFLVVYNALI
ncbi:MAG TPA: site-2 protease family protein [Opitutaceae bacterium]